MAEKRPKTLASKSIKTSVGCGNIFIHITSHNDEPFYEIFGNLGHGSQCGRVQTSSIGKLASHARRAGVPADKIMLDLLGETCDRWSGSPDQCRSCADAFGKAIGFALGLFDEDLQPIKGKEDGE